MKKSLIILFWVISVTGYAQFPESLSTELQAILNIYDTPSKPYGTSVSVNIEGYGTWSSTVGFSHTNVDLDTNMLLGIGSNTKLFTSVLCLKMAENGLLDLDDPISTWLPTYSNINPAITLRQLLQHTSGIDDYVDYLFPDSVLNNPNHIYTASEVLGSIGSPLFTAGLSLSYSSTNYYLAAMILEQITGETYTNLVHDSILTPLGLAHVYVEGWENIPETVAHPWYLNSDLGSVSRVGIGTLSWSAGCIVATPKDMVLWYQKLFGTNFLTASSKSEMTTFINWPGVNAKMGLGVYQAKIFTDTLWGHSGQTIGYNSVTYYHPVRKFSISVIINDTYKNPGSLTNTLIKEIITQLTVLGSAEIPEKLSDIAIYPNPSDGSNVTIRSTKNLPITKIRVLDVNGRTWMEIGALNTPQKEIDISILSSGVYFIVTEINGVLQFEKLVVE